MLHWRLKYPEICFKPFCAPGPLPSIAQIMGLSLFYLQVQKYFLTSFNIFLKVFKYFWPCSNIQIHKVNLTFDHGRNILTVLSMVKKFWTQLKYFWTCSLVWLHQYWFYFYSLFYRRMQQRYSIYMLIRGNTVHSFRFCAKWSWGLLRWFWWIQYV